MPSRGDAAVLAVWVLGAVVVLAVLAVPVGMVVFAVLGIWTGDVRWLWTAGVLLGVVVLSLAGRWVSR